MWTTGQGQLLPGLLPVCATPAEDAEPSAQYCCSLLWFHTVEERHTCAWWPQEAVVSCDIHSHTRGQTHTCLTSPADRNITTHMAQNGCNEYTQRAESAHRRSRMRSITWRGEGEEGAALPPAAWRFDLQLPHPRTTTPRPKKKLGKR